MKHAPAIRTIPIVPACGGPGTIDDCANYKEEIDCPICIETRAFDKYDAHLNEQALLAGVCCHCGTRLEEIGVLLTCPECQTIFTKPKVAPDESVQKGLRGALSLVDKVKAVIK